MAISSFSRGESERHKPLLTERKRETRERESETRESETRESEKPKKKSVFLRPRKRVSLMGTRMSTRVIGGRGLERGRGARGGWEETRGRGNIFDLLFQCEI